MESLEKDAPSSASAVSFGPGLKAKSLQDLLANHEAGDDREALALEKMSFELARLKEPCSRRSDVVHFTASGIVVGKRGILLHRHKLLGRWMQPGGHIDPVDKTPLAAARRECEEETGLVLSYPKAPLNLLHADVHEAANSHIHLDLRFTLFAPNEDPRPPPGESQDVAWFSFEEAIEVADEALLGALLKVRDLAKHFVVYGACNV